MFSKGDLVYIPQNSIMYGFSNKERAPASIKINPSPLLGVFVESCSDNKTGKVMLPDGMWQIKLKEIYLNRPEKKC